VVAVAVARGGQRGRRRVRRSGLVNGKRWTRRAGRRKTFLELLDALDEEERSTDALNQ
jgi:hypothetical protein